MKNGMFVAGMVAILLIAGCGAEEAAKTTDALNPGFYMEGETVTSPDGARTVNSGAAAILPDDFPKDVPRYEGVQFKWVEEDAVANTVAFAATTVDPQATVADFYKKEAEANGWSVARKFEIGGGSTTLVYSKGTRMLRLGIMGTSEPTIIMLTVTKE